MIRRQFKKKEFPKLKVISVKCNRCFGVGFYPDKNDQAITCEKCEGKGYVDSN